MMEESEGSTSAGDSLENATFSPRNFDFSKPSWKKRFERYLSSADASAKSDAEKLEALRCIMGEETETALAQLVPDIKDKTPTEVLQVFSEHFLPQKNVILERYRFNSRIQETDESVDRFITALQKLAETCQYGNMKDELIRDRLIVGLLDTKTSVLLRLKSHLTLEDAMTIARQTDPPRAQPESEDDAEESPKHNVLLFPSIICISGPFWDLSTRSTGNVQNRQYQKVRKVLDKLSPRNFDKSVNQLQALRIDSEEMLQGVVDLIYAKAIAVPQLGSLCARMCKNLSMLRVGSPNDQGGEEDHPIHLKDLVLTRHVEFKKDFEEIETLSDPMKKKEILLAYIGFMHEIHKQLMIPLILLLSVIQYCVEQMSKGSLECLKPYLEQMLDIRDGKTSEITEMIRSISRDVCALTFIKPSKKKLQTNNEIEKDIKTESLGDKKMPRGKRSLLVCHQNDVQLREIDNPWRRGQQRPGYNGNGNSETHALYKSVKVLLNKLTPQKFETLMNQLRSLKIDTQERSEGVVDLVFDYAVHISGVTKPNYSAVCALMCKELAMMQASGSDTKAGREESNFNFRELIITRCQMEFEKNSVDENVRAIEMTEIEACPDPDRKKELRHILNEEERKIRVKSVGQIRFIGELYKQGTLTNNIMHRCIRRLLTQIDEESLECLCMLLRTIGKDMEAKGQSLEVYFKQMLELVTCQGPGRVSPRICFMLKDVIELRSNEWVPRRYDSDPKTMDQIRKEVETERLDTPTKKSPMNVPKKGKRHSDRNRNPVGEPTEKSGLSAPVRSRRSRDSAKRRGNKNLSVDKSTAATMSSSMDIPVEN